MANKFKVKTLLLGGQDVTASGNNLYVNGVMASASSSGVSSINSASGALTLAGAGNVSVTTNAQTITISGNTGAYSTLVFKSETGQFIGHNETGDFAGLSYVNNTFSKATVTGSSTILSPDFTGAGNVSLRLVGSQVIVSGNATAPGAHDHNYVTGLTITGGAAITGAINFQSAGSITVVQNGNTVTYSGSNVGGVGGSASGILFGNSIFMESPAGGDNICWFYNREPVTLTRVISVARGTGCGIDWELWQTPDRSQYSGLVVSGRTLSLTTGNTILSGDFNKTTLSGNVFVLFKTVSTSGSIADYSLTLIGEPQLQVMSGQIFQQQIDDLRANTGFYYLRTNPSGYIMSSETGQFIGHNETGDFAGLSYVNNTFSKVSVTGSSIVLSPDLTGAGSVVVRLVGSQIQISGTATGQGGGEANTASNLGNGVGAVSGKQGVDLRFYSFTGAGGTTVSLAGSEIRISGDNNFVTPAQTGNFADKDYVTGASGYLRNLINAASAGVSSVNGASGALTLASAGNISISTNAQTITISGNTGDYSTFVFKSETGQFIGHNETGEFAGKLYVDNTFVANSNTGQFASDIDVSTVQTQVTTINNWTGTTTGIFIQRIESGQYVGHNETGDFAGLSYVNNNFSKVTVSGSSLVLAPDFSGVGAISVKLVGSQVLVSGSAAAGEANTASNLGNGMGVWADKNGVDLRFYSLTGVSGVQIERYGNEILISGASNAGINLLNTLTGEVTLSGAGNVTVTSTGQVITISGAAGGGGEANTASNLGAGVGIASGKVGVDLQFYSLSGVGGTSVSLVGSEIRISGAAQAAPMAFSKVGIFQDPNGIITGSYILPIWRACCNCMVTGIHGFRLGVSGATINAQKNWPTGVSLLSTSMPLTGNGAGAGGTGFWISSGTIVSGNFNMGDSLDVRIETISGFPSYIGVQVDFVTI